MRTLIIWTPQSLSVLKVEGGGSGVRMKSISSSGARRAPFLLDIVVSFGAIKLFSDLVLEKSIVVLFFRVRVV